MDGKQIRQLSACALLSAAVLFAFPGETKAQEEAVYRLEYYQYNTCASCHPEEDFYTIVSEEIGDLKEAYPYQIYEYNTFHAEDHNRLKEKLEEHHASPDTAQPLVIAGDTVLSGLDAIRDGLRDTYLAFVSEEAVSETEDISAESSAAVQETAEVSADVRAELAAALADDEEGDAVLLYFSTLSCDDCTQVKEFLEELGSTNANLKIHEWNIADGDHVLLLQTLFQVYDVPAAQQQVPILFYNGGYFPGAKAAREGLADALAAGEVHAFPADLLSEAAAEKAASASAADYGSLLTAGLVNGINPCGASMLLMLLAAAVMAEKSVLAVGLSYLAGKFIAYCAMGLGLYQIFQTIWQDTLLSVSRLLTRCFAAVFFVLALLYLRDFLYAQKKEYGKIKMQLPGKLRKWNHNRIKELSEKKNHWLLGAVALLGIVISAGEFFCTGQVYLASILYLMKLQTSRQMETLSVFLLYVGAMCVPSLILTVVLHRTRNAVRLSNMTLKWLPAIKLITAAAFLFFAVFMLISG